MMGSFGLVVPGFPLMERRVQGSEVGGQGNNRQNRNVLPSVPRPLPPYCLHVSKLATTGFDQSRFHFI